MGKVKKIMKRLEKAVQHTLFDCLGLQPGQSLLVIAHSKQLELAHQFRKTAERNKLELFILELPSSHNKRPLFSLLSKSLIAVSDKVLLFCSHVDSESVMWLRQQKETPVVVWPHADEEKVIRCMDVDFRRLRERSRKVSDILTIGRTLTITSESGTSLEMSIHQRSGTLEMIPLDQNQFCASIPLGRAFITPVANSANGEILLDRVAGQRSSSSEAIVIKVLEGKLNQIRGGKGADGLRKRLRAPSTKSENPKKRTKSDTSRRFVEIGFGMNEIAKLGQNELEDEKVLGTAHVGLGRRDSSSKSIKALSKGIISNPTVSIDGREIMQKGKLMFE